jgi:hypothetical protein
MLGWGESMDCVLVVPTVYRLALSRLRGIMGTCEILYDLFSGKVVVRHSDSLFSLA